MTNLEKLDALKAFLRENALDFIENKTIKSGITIDLLVLKYNVAVHLSDEHDQRFFKRTRNNYHPFYIRESETVEFIIEKMQNCLTTVMVDMHKSYQRKQAAATKEPVVKAQEKPKRPRVKINTVRYEKV